MATPLEVAQSRLDAYLAAELAILQNQSYEIAGRRLTRADLAVVRQAIVDLQGEVAAIGGTRGRRFGVVRMGF